MSRRSTSTIPLLLVLFPHLLFAQAARRGRLEVTVLDPSSAVIPGATVTISPEDDATRAVPEPAAQTSSQGVATIGNLVPGRYTVQAEYPGFETHIVKDVRVRAGDNKQVIVLAIAKLQDTLTVARDAQEAAADARGRAFGTAVAREQIDALSENLDEAERQLRDIAGGLALIRVDGFEGAPLPPKSQIRSIHITRDAFAAENHFAGQILVDIVTQPGLGALNGGGTFRLRDGSMSGRSPFTPTKGPERTQNFSANIAGTLKDQKSSFSLAFNGMTAYETPILNVATPAGTRSEALNLRSPRDTWFVSGLFDYALTKDQTLRIRFFQGLFSSRNLGVGAYDLPERAYSTEQRNANLQVQQVGPLGRRSFLNTRVSFSWGDMTQRSGLDAPTIRVSDAFTSGGQQLAGSRQPKTFGFGFDLDYIRGRHSVRTGAQINLGFADSDLRSNYLGTYTFESLAAYEAGAPRSFTKRIGEPTIHYFQSQSGTYVQDDIRLRKNLTLSPGVRFDLQFRPSLMVGVGPRFGVTWAPFKTGKTTLRGSAGIFYDYLEASTYEQIQRVDGFHQRELTVLNPSYPTVGDVGSIPPVSRYFLSPDLTMPRTGRFSAGIEQTLLTQLRVGVLYNYLRSSHVLHGVNVNAPINGFRPDITFANVIEVVPDGRARQHTLGFTFTVGAPLRPQLPANSPRMDWHRINLAGIYTAGTFRNNTDGDFTVAPSGSLADEWGPSPVDIRHRANLSLNTQVLKNFTTSLTFTAFGGSPFTILTGLDVNGDQIFNDRPVGVGRNTARGAAQATVSGNFVYTLSFGKRGGTLPPGIAIGTTGGVNRVDTFARDPVRLRVQLFANVQNLTNHVNYGGYSGVMTSPFFGLPTLVTNPRKVDVGLNLSF